MAIPLLEDDVEIISKLGDTPGSDDGLTAQQLKARFDAAAVIIKSYINNTLISYLNQLVDVQALLDGILDDSLSAEDKAANAKAAGDALSKKMDTAGGTFTGLVGMSNFRIIDVGAPVELTDAATKGYCDAKHLMFNVVLTADGWSDSAPYTQTVEMADILATDRPHWGVILSDSLDTALAEKEAFAVVDDLDTADGSVIFTCLEEKPDTDLTIQLEVNR